MKIEAIIGHRYALELYSRAAFRPSETASPISDYQYRVKWSDGLETWEYADTVMKLSPKTLVNYRVKKRGHAKRQRTDGHWTNGDSFAQESSACVPPDHPFDVPLPQWDSQSYVEMANSFAQILKYCPLYGSSSKRDILEWLDRVVKAMQFHYHNLSCKKSGGDNTDEACRFAFPRLIALMSFFREAGTSFVLERQAGPFIPYILSWTMAVPGNTLMNLVSEMGRWYRDHHLWSRDRAKGLEVRRWPISSRLDLTLIS